MTKKKKLVVQAGEQLDSWGTPRWVIDLALRATGHTKVAVDLASNAAANKTVKARRIYTVDKPCPDVVPGLRYGQGFVWCNPPGPVEEVRRFWDIWQRCVSKTWVGGFLIFNMDHWRTLSSPRLVYEVVILKNRLKFVGAPHQYNHPSALVLYRVLKLSMLGGHHSVGW